MKWKLLLIAMLTCFCIALNAQTVGYSYKIFSEAGCGVDYCVVKQDTSYFIVAMVQSDNMSFMDNPVMKIRTFKGDVLEFKGNVISNSNSSSSTGTISGNTVVTGHTIKANAQFEVSPQEFEKLNDGVQKIRLTMIPVNHEREFKKDMIGGKLYQFYLKAKDSDDDF